MNSDALVVIGLLFGVPTALVVAFLLIKDGIENDERWQFAVVALFAIVAYMFFDIPNW